jgi:hypothetical protein
MSANVPAQTKIFLRSTQYQVVNAVTQTYAISGPVLLNAGDIVYVTIDQNSGAIVQAVVDNAYSENRFTVIPM